MKHSDKKTSDKKQTKPKTNWLVVITMVALVALIVGVVLFYQATTDGPPTANPLKTFVSGTIGPQKYVNNYTSIYFIDTTTQITYASPIANGNYSLILYTGSIYDVTIQMFTSKFGPTGCAATPATITTSGLRQTQHFDCNVNY